MDWLLVLTGRRLSHVDEHFSHLCEGGNGKPLFVCNLLPRIAVSSLFGCPFRIVVLLKIFRSHKGLMHPEHWLNFI
jgi:hypothetical protein